ncbi:2,3-dihydroxyphenylpropionate/2,3-dihydroxicinnam ic acid 1,2-dioxygenase [Acidocella aquatica]|uniref:2,3-dihydroxyphenylpropionate/2, 3-dihydroxicinnam ic acid 1,2-dioxygenase n=1 Tax=Acidocella aquatica TaxID=1922313 RepID=A0ABQ6A8Q6_9PROT|nr:3-carboxyethylcatechol 2,3-dioxygenase [Acidocella aquatica]GLR66982.1 2,3-dihydroxyphenylpropionate/2,3-dihydroxicinnam ic acid 1,2-dioxygenase [Acidocella aquatica]
MPLTAICASHTPLMKHITIPPDTRGMIDGAFQALAGIVRDSKPDLIIQFSPDHFNGFFYELMPAFCVGTAAESIGDWGTKPGPLNVPEDIAAALAKALLDSGIDAAVSYKMRVDHGFIQLWENMLDDLPSTPLIPIFINCAAPPLPTFQRVRLLGEAAGRFALATGKRVLFAASGGLSHDPPTPQLATAAPEIRARIINRFSPTPEERAQRETRIIEIGTLAQAGKASVLPVSEVWDRAFLDTVQHHPVSTFDAQSTAALAPVAGRGGPEVLCWLAALAALSTAGPYDTKLHFYEAIQGWIAGMALLSAQTR